MLINLTNHPISKWTEEQLSTAKQYGEVVDYPFPNVSPSMSSAEIKHLALAVYADIRGNYDGEELIIHIMGEFTLTYSLLNLFRSEGIRCIASTTERIVEEKEDGTKEVKFKFIQFRDYE